jgi:hypothetical protein
MQVYISESISVDKNSTLSKKILKFADYTGVK